jgi:hypothetical protein
VVERHSYKVDVLGPIPSRRTIKNHYMKTVSTPITRKELKSIASGGFGNLVKAVVDIKKHIMEIDASLHADEEAYLLSTGSNQSDLWGINLYPDLAGADFIEFDSMINLRPSQGNTSRGVDDPKIQEIIKSIVKLLIS